MGFSLILSTFWMGINEIQCWPCFSQAGIVDNLRAFQSQHKMKKAGPEGDAESLLEDL